MNSESITVIPQSRVSHVHSRNDRGVMIDEPPRLGGRIFVISFPLSPGSRHSRLDPKTTMNGKKMEAMPMDDEDLH